MGLCGSSGTVTGYTKEELDAVALRAIPSVPLISRVSRNEYSVIAPGFMFNPMLPGPAASFFDGRLSEADFAEMIREINDASLYALLGLPRRYPMSELQPRFMRSVNAAAIACAAVNERFQAKGIPAFVSVQQAGHTQMITGAHVNVQGHSGQVSMSSRHTFNLQLRLVFDDNVQRAPMPVVQAATVVEPVV